MPGVLLGVLLAQATAAGPDAAALDHIRRTLAKQAVLIADPPAQDADTRVIRVKIRGWTFDHPAWHDDTTVPLYVRPTMPPVHFEFLEQVTPELFRASVLYPPPFGVPLVPIAEAVARKIKAQKRRMAEEAAREEVRAALASLSACRTGSTRPGC